MSRILGASDQGIAAGAGSASRRLSPRGAFGTQPGHIPDSGPGRSTRIQSIKRAEQNIRDDIKKTREQIAFLDERGLKGNASWVSFERAASFEDWVAKNKAAMEGPRSLRKVLEREIKSSLDSLHSLEIAARKLERLEVEAEKARRLNESPAEASLDLALLARRFLRKLRKGHADKTLEAELDVAIDRALKKWTLAVNKDPSVKNIKGTLHLVGQLQWLGSGGKERMTEALRACGLAVVKRRQAAESAFRNNPTVENFKGYLSAWIQARTLGADPGELTPANLPKRVHGDGSYAVKPGDTLRSLSKYFFGSESYWDSIVLSNFGTLKSLAEPLRAGTRLTIPSG